MNCVFVFAGFPRKKCIFAFLVPRFHGIMGMNISYALHV